ncbi:MAG: arginine deiminase-related protein [Saprospiraceae bacterium]
MDQVTSHVMMIRPSAFGYNAETAVNNVFQHKPDAESSSEVASEASREFDAFAQLLQREGIDVTVLKDSIEPKKPDAVFPNNWISFHDDGKIVTYPMYSVLRRNERREDLISQLASHFRIVDRVRLEDYEHNNQYLEGTGSMVLDRVAKIAYACISERTNKELLDIWCTQMGYTAHTFHAISNEKPIYHTNVMMAIASDVAVVCLECVPDPSERRELKNSLSLTHVLIEITDAQVQSFAGNMLALKNNKGEELMVMSARAENSLTSEQKNTIEEYCRIVASPINTIEDIGGGSARCMIAEIFLVPN